MNKLFGLLLLTFGAYMFFGATKSLLTVYGYIVVPPNPYAYGKGSVMVGAIVLYFISFACIGIAYLINRKKKEPH